MFGVSRVFMIYIKKVVCSCVQQVLSRCTFPCRSANAKMNHPAAITRTHAPSTGRRDSHRMLCIAQCQTDLLPHPPPHPSPDPSLHPSRKRGVNRLFLIGCFPEAASQSCKGVVLVLALLGTQPTRALAGWLAGCPQNH